MYFIPAISLEKKYIFTECIIYLHEIPKLNSLKTEGSVNKYTQINVMYK